MTGTSLVTSSNILIENLNHISISLASTKSNPMSNSCTKSGYFNKEAVSLHSTCFILDDPNDGYQSGDKYQCLIEHIDHIHKLSKSKVQSYA